MNSPVLLTADQLSETGHLSYSDRSNAWSIDVQGTLIVSGSVFGAGITCHGICSLDGANMSSTGPIEVFGEMPPLLTPHQRWN